MPLYYLVMFLALLKIEFSCFQIVASLSFLSPFN